MSHDFDKAYWEGHWGQRVGTARSLPAHPALETEIARLHPGTALDAGSGEGAEALWLAKQGWEVTAVDISAHALTSATAQPSLDANAGSVAWVEADLITWAPDEQFDLVTTFYAHPNTSQHAFYERISQWVAPGGTLLIVGHQDDDHRHGRGQAHPENAVTQPEQIRALFTPGRWVVRTAEVRERTVAVSSGHSTTLHDVIACIEKI
ncbi:class I SAM-dependent methyltransferase [Microbacterium sp. KSW2-21]|uniref:Class I SAM-dependent methyltransferase n=1 Tax=Microbacterium algihabitans TaxID=3075992 RepID=A0ABU3S074_9MICO|nr:class I SAM-dependent methyltransferase [Microbacterium sp. KSW2-21]MDU0328512.1 class I SAM-dependent methyltransferase [Microbacterium sp. KSW2-21]